MAKHDKEIICRVFAGLLLPPDREMVEQGRWQDFHSFLGKRIDSLQEEGGFLKGLRLEGEVDSVLEELSNEYDHLFSGVRGKGISLVESCYKPWTRDFQCTLSFAAEQGLLMGDSAFHLLDVYRQFGLEVADEFKGLPDHLVMELEFLSYLYKWGREDDVRMFVADHLDWIPLLREEIEKVRPHSFYGSLVDVLDLFLQKERKPAHYVEQTCREGSQSLTKRIVLETNGLQRT
jgi:putative dimethyl sulfoxide reductase chaperone